jgi:predicted MFS family arabinose efflux permease
MIVVYLNFMNLCKDEKFVSPNLLILNRMIIKLYKNAFAGLSRPTWLLSIVMLINRSGTMVIPFMSLYMTRHINTSYAAAGIVMGLFGAGSILGALAGGKLSDKIGYYKVMCGALFFGGILFIILGQITSYTGICITVFILALANEAFRPANMSAVAKFSNPENRSRSVSLNRLAVNMGWAVGSSLGGYFAGFNYTLLFWVDGISNLLALFLIIYLLPRHQFDVKPAPKTANQIKTKPAYADGPYVAFILLSILFAACFFQCFTTLPLFYADGLHLSEHFIGYVMAMNGLVIGVFEMIIVYLLEGKKKITFYIGTGVLLCGFSFLMYTFLPGTHLLALFAMLLLTIGEMVAFPFKTAFWMGRSAPHNRGQYAGMYTMSWSIAQVLGPPIGSAIAQNQGFKFLWLVIGSVTVLTGLFYYFLPVQKNNPRLQ